MLYDFAVKVRNVSYNKIYQLVKINEQQRVLIEFDVSFPMLSFKGLIELVYFKYSILSYFAFYIFLLLCV